MKAYWPAEKRAEGFAGGVLLTFCHNFFVRFCEVPESGVGSGTSVSRFGSPLLGRSFGEVLGGQPASQPASPERVESGVRGSLNSKEAQRYHLVARGWVRYTGCLSPKRHVCCLSRPYILLPAGNFSQDMCFWLPSLNPSGIQSLIFHDLTVL